MKDKKITLKDHKEIRERSGSDAYKKLSLLKELYLTDDNTEKGAQLMDITDVIYVGHGLQPQKMKKWLKKLDLTKENYRTVPVYIIEYSNCDLFLFHGHHRMAAHKINGGSQIYAYIQKDEEQFDPQGCKTLDEIISEYIGKSS